MKWESIEENLLMYYFHVQQYAKYNMNLITQIHNENVCGNHVSANKIWIPKKMKWSVKNQKWTLKVLSTFTTTSIYKDLVGGRIA